ncbi:hypothetical protein ACHQM5_017060 [Ranunculus cassubicifolius]
MEIRTAMLPVSVSSIPGAVELQSLQTQNHWKVKDSMIPGVPEKLREQTQAFWNANSETKPWPPVRASNSKPSGSYTQFFGELQFWNRHVLFYIPHSTSL